MQLLNHRLFLFIFFSALTVFLLVMALLTEGPYIGTDSINHYFIARNAFREPANFLDSWGRPFYTTLSAPFTLLGFTGSMLFNILAAVMTAWLAFRIARDMKPDAPLMVVVMIIFTPIYTVMLFTAMTETLFGFMLVCGAFLFLRKKFVLAALTYSFLPLVRNEGFILLPIIFLALIYMKQYRAIPFLAAGVLIYSLAGIPVFHDPFWMITRFPYSVTKPHPVYTDQGSLFHYITAYPFIFGLPLALFLLLGILVMLKDTLSPNENVSRSRMIEIWLVIVLPFIVYFIFHSLLFWQASGYSTGRVRFISAVTPLAAVIAWWGYTLVNRFLLKNWLRLLFFLVVSVWIILTSVKQYPIPPPLGREEVVIVEATDWLTAYRKPEQRLFYTDPRIPFYMGLNGFDKEACNCSWYFIPAGFQWFRPGDILIWESHFGPNECNTPLDTFKYHPDFRLIGHFEPPRPLVTLKNRLYEIYVFQRTAPGIRSDNDLLLDSVRNARVSGFDSLYLGGVDSVIMDNQREFSPGVSVAISALTPVRNRLCVRTSVNVFSDSAYGENQAALVVSVTDSNKIITYNPVYFDKPALIPGQWNEVRMTVWLEDILSDRYKLKIYVWNPARRTFALKDLKGYLMVPPPEQ